MRNHLLLFLILAANTNILLAQDNANNTQTTRRLAPETASASPSFVLNTPSFANAPVSLRDYDELLFSWQIPDAATTAQDKASYSLELSPNGTFDADDETHGKPSASIGSDYRFFTVAYGSDTNHLSVPSWRIDSIPDR